MTSTTELVYLSEGRPSNVRSHHTDGNPFVLRAQPPHIATDNEQPPEGAVDAVPDGGYGWTIVFVCSLFLFWSSGYLATWGVLQAAMLRSSYLTVDVWTLSFVGSVALACIVTFGLISVRLMRIFGARYTCVTATLLFSLGPILASLTLDNLGGLFCTAGALVGLGCSFLCTASNSMPVQWFSGKLGTANGLIKAGGGIGATVLPIAVQGVINTVGLPWAFRIFGLLILATGIPASLLIKERASIGHSSRIDWSMLRNLPFLCLCLSGAVSTFALFVPSFFLPLFANSIGLSPSMGAALVAGFGLSSTLGRLISGFSCDRIGSLNTLAITMLANAVSMLAIWPVSSSLAPLVIFAAVNGGANGSFFVALPTAIASLAGAGSAAGAMGIANSFWAPGYLLGSPVAGILISATGAAESASIDRYFAAIFYSGGVGLLGALLVLAARLKKEMKMLKKL